MRKYKFRLRIDSIMLICVLISSAISLLPEVSIPMGKNGGNSFYLAKSRHPISTLLNPIEDREYFFHISLHRMNSMIDLYFLFNEKVYSIFKPLYDFNEVVARKLSTTPDNSMYLLMLLSTMVLSVVYRLLPFRSRGSAKLKYCFNGFFGFLILCIQFKWTVLHVVLTSVVCYLCLRFLPARWSTGITFVGMFVYTSLFQVFELVQYYLIKRRSIRTVLMLELFRLSSVPFNLLDGQRFGSKKKEEGTRSQKKTYQEEVALSKCPGVLEYFSYVFNYTTVIAGPIVEFKHYANFVEGGSNKSGGKEQGKKKIPIHWGTILKKLGGAVFVFILYNVLNKLKINAGLIKSANLTDVDNLLTVLFYTYVAMFFFRLKYYFAWGFAEAVCIFVGLGYSPQSKDNKWEHVSTYSFLDFESATSVRTMINSWNISVSKFFRYYVYERVALKSRTLKSTLVMILSAFWHGFYPGYYISWTFVIFLNQIYIDVYKRWKPKFLQPKMKMGRLSTRNFLELPIRFVMSILCMFSVSYFFVPFLLLSWAEVSAYYAKFYWGFHFVLIIVFIVIKLLK